MVIGDETTPDFQQPNFLLGANNHEKKMLLPRG